MQKALKGSDVGGLVTNLAFLESIVHSNGKWLISAVLTSSLLMT